MDDCSKAEPPLPLTEGSPTKVLVIDDNLLVRETIADQLLGAGYETEVASNGVEGIALFKAMHPAVVITDILMPDKDGIETIRELRAINPKVKIIAVSGGGLIVGREYLAMAGLLGASATLAKPFQPDELLETVARVIAAP